MAMLDRIFSLWFWFGSNRPGFFLGTAGWSAAILLLYYGGVHATLSLGPGGDLPGFTDVLLYSFSHEDLPSLLVNIAMLLLLGPCQERRWGTVAFVALSLVSTVTIPPLYALVLFVGGGEASRICGSSAAQLALFTAQCRQARAGSERTIKRTALSKYDSVPFVRTKEPFKRIGSFANVTSLVPVWFLPWLVLLACLLLLPGTPALLHFCAICLGHNYRQSFIGVFQELEDSTILNCVPEWACVLTSVRLRLPTYTTSKRSGSQSQSRPAPSGADDHSACNPTRDPSPGHRNPGPEPSPSWPMEGAAALREQQLGLLEEQMMKAGILASLQELSEDPDAKVEVAKSSVSSLRLQQLERMGFPTEKAVVALAASKQLDGAISLLIDDRVGDKSVMVSKGKSTPSA